ncbi:MAG: transporter substrate-binding domain-containing protein [Pseudomonas sp.]|uniref:substrate-binding periplasmic protein n=1 Tax=Pseudomonas sp. TaxID=306 RepID=UPI00339A82D9
MRAVISATCLGLGLSVACMAAEVVTLTNGEYPPYQSEHAPHYGIASHVVSAAFALEGVTVQYVFLPWKRAYQEAENGRYDGSLVWTIEASRQQTFHFSDPVFDGQSVFFQLKSNPFSWHSFDDLVDSKIGGTLGYTYEFEKDPRIKVERARTDVENFRKLLAGRFDLFPSDLQVGYAVLKQNFSAEEIARITHNPKVYNSTTYHLILNRQHPRNQRLIAVFNRGLQKLRDSGKYAEYFALPP